MPLLRIQKLGDIFGSHLNWLSAVSDITDHYFLLETDSLGSWFSSFLFGCFSQAFAHNWLPTEPLYIELPQHLILDPLTFYSKRFHPCPKHPLYKYTNNSYNSLPAKELAWPQNRLSIPMWTLQGHLEIPHIRKWPMSFQGLQIPKHFCLSSCMSQKSWLLYLLSLTHFKVLPMPVPFIVCLICIHCFSIFKASTLSRTSYSLSAE